MQRQEEYPPPPSRHHDTNLASTHAPVRQQQAGAAGGALPPHMAHSHPSYAQPQYPQQARNNYQAPPSAAAQQDQRADPLPPHLQHMPPTQGRGGPSGQTPAARHSGIPDHLQPRPFSQQRDTSPRRRSHGQVQGVQQPKRPNPQQQSQPPPLQQQQQPLQQQQQQQQQQAMMGTYPPQGAATGVRHPGPSPQAMNASGPARTAPAVGAEAAYQAQMPYVSGGGSGAGPLPATPALDPVTDAAGQPTGAPAASWYQATGGAQHTQAQTGHFSAAAASAPQQQPMQQQQGPYETEYQQAPVYAAAPAAPQQHLQQPQSQQVQQQYPPPPSLQHAPPLQQQHQYQQQPYQQPSRPLPPDDDDVRQVPLGQHVSGQVPSLSGQAPVLHGTTGVNNNSAAQTASPEALQYPPPPAVQLTRATVEVTSTPVSFVQLVPQTAGIQVDHCGAVRVVAPPTQQEAAAAAAGAGSGQPAMPPSQHAATAVYGPAPTQQQQRQQQQQQAEPHAQPQRYSSMSGPSSALAQHPQPSQPQQQHVSREQPLPAAVIHSYDLSPAYQQPGANGGPSGTMWDEAAGHREAVPAYAPYASSRLDNGGGDGRAYLSAAAERSRPPPPTVQLPQDSGYVVYDDSVAGRYQGAAGGDGGQERRSSRPQAPELDGMAIDAYANSPGVQRIVIERLGSRGDGGGGGYMETVPPRRPSAGGGGRVSYTSVAQEPPLQLEVAISRAQKLLRAVAATRADGELMSGMLPQLLQNCEKRMHDLSCLLAVAKADASAAREAADAAEAAADKAAADAAKATAAAAAAEDDEELGNVRAGHFAFLLERSIRTVWPLDTPEHQLYRAVAETLLLEEGGRVVPVNNEEVRLKPYEMVGATLCNVAAVQERVAEVRAAGGTSTMVLLRDSKVAGFFDIKEHTHKQDPRSLQWLVRLKAEKLPSYAEVRRVLRFGIDTLLPPPPPAAAAPTPAAGARKSARERSSTKPESALPPPPPTQQQQRPSSGQLRSSSPTRGGRSSFTDADGGAAAPVPSLQLPFVGREPEGEEERQVLRHVALHLLSCKGKEIGLFQDRIETAAEKLPPHLAKVYGKGRVGLAELQLLLKSHPFFWVATKSVYTPDGLTCSSHACVSLHSNTILEFAYRANVVLEEREQEVAHQSKRRRTGPVGGAGGGGGGSADGADALEAWWQGMRSLRPSPQALGGGA
ncbi:hypothetical protein PLESTB_000188300 [Pleodorina starrii]|uniref:Uncharacterized protein n=1 Tax=Pleodorina starrii TaxID=330485 RepID=A0A9W6EYK0_9CHLO|nr:hypothetical protein PLESTM_000342800 [Pleodorina starrii]GLC49156.1 hypothetical protein PLESTB_000188300 [Pleodorina starrii]GLC73587.1 hypothetical protein PLESTF_001394300 [Pleodorina starrii]